jgi:NAD-dependent histone deacetylase SIR2
MVITGAGISTSLGIPDFRSKTTGFYSKLQDMGYSEPEEVFDIVAFDEDPSIFYKLAADILPDLKHYSPTHAFIRLLQDKNKLQTNYTQNIDNLEELAGIDKNRLIQCHGSFATATCRKCKYKVKGTDIFPAIRAKRVARCKRCISNIATQEALGPKVKKRKPTPRRTTHSDSDDEDEDDDIPQPGVMKPDITFFGEALPDHFFTRFTEQDVNTVDLVLVIGTSLKVAPVSDMPNYLPHQ